MILKMKLIRLRSIANNAVRPSNWATVESGSHFDPFEHVQPRGTFIVDLISGAITWETEGKEMLVSDDSVEKYYKAMAQWFHDALAKEEIPLDVIESAIIKITSEVKQCIIVAGGKTFKSMRMAMSP